MPKPRSTTVVRKRGPDREVALVGPGRLGQALGYLLSRAGVKIGWVAARRAPAAREAARFIGAGQPVAIGSAEIAQAKVLLITTSDSALPRVARKLAGRRESWRGSVVLHTSGAWPAGGAESVLQPFRERGAEAAALHPLQTVPRREAGVRNLIGCFWAIEGDPAAVRLARQWVRALGGTSFTLPANRKPSYHAAAVIACAGVVTLMDSARRLLAGCGVRPRRAGEMLQGFVAETAKNFALLGPRRALTGPVMRGDWRTLREHLRALRRRTPDLVPLYQELLRAMVHIAGRRAPRRRSRTGQAPLSAL